MIDNIVIIASTAGCLVEMLSEILRDNHFKVLVANNNQELTERIKKIYPRYIFLEQCFNGSNTDEYLAKLKKSNQSLHIIMWTCNEIKPIIGARYIHAGAESFFTLREKKEKLEKILTRIRLGETYCPADVEAVLDKDFSIPIIGEPLTNREKEILKLSGYTNKKIASILSVTPHTVKYHKTNIFKKCGGERSFDIICNAISKGFIDLDEYTN